MIKRAFTVAKAQSKDQSTVNIIFYTKDSAINLILP